MAHEYEIVVIIRPDIEDADTLATIVKIETTVTDNGGHILERDDWGKRKLAYLIDKHTKGHYMLLRVVASPEQVLEIERKMRLDDRVIRFLTVKIAEAIDVEFRLKQAAEQRKVKAEEAARRAAEAALRGTPDEDEDDDEDDDTDEARRMSAD